MTKELYPRPRSKIGELVAFSHKDAKELVYHQMKVTGAYFKARWVYVGLASTFDSKKGYIRYGVVADEDEIVENLTTGYRLINEEWLPPNYKDILRERAELEAVLQQNGYLHPNQLITEEPSVDSFGNPKS